MYPDKHLKDTVIVVQGHKYTFFSNGIYLCADLFEYYNIVLVVPQSYRVDQRFLKICELMSFHEVIYFDSTTYLTPDQKGSSYWVSCVKQFFHQKSYSETSKRLMLKYHPVAVLQHDYIHMENLYFFYWANRLITSCKKITVLSTAPSNEKTLLGFSEMRRRRVFKLVRGNRVLGYFLCWLYTLLKLTESCVRNILIPLLVLRHKSDLGLSGFDNIDIKPSKLPFDYFMVFEEAEETFYGKLFGDIERVKRVSSPISSGARINSQIFHIGKVKDILILFSLTGTTGFDTEILDRWCELIFTLSKKYTNTKINIKFHPNLSYKLSCKFKTYIKSKCPYSNVFDSQAINTSTEGLIIDSWLVIGDSSSVLVWASYVGDKVVLSMDIGGTVNSRDMECYSGITMFSKDDDFSKIIENINPLEFLKTHELSLPSVKDFIV